MTTDTTEILDSSVFKQSDETVKPRHYAGAGKRFVNLLVDTIVFYILVMLSAVFYVIITQQAEMGNFTAYFMSFSIMIFYYTIIEGLTGKSIAKFITKTKVVNIDFSKPDIGTIFIRSLCRIIPFEPFSYLGSDARGWHDTITKTYVIDEKSLN